MQKVRARCRFRAEGNKPNSSTFLKEMQVKKHLASCRASPEGNPSFSLTMDRVTASLKV